MASESVNGKRVKSERTKRGSCGKILRGAWLSTCALLIVCCAACGSTGTSQRTASTPQKTDFERKLDIVRRAPHVKIYVVRRKDSAPLAADDKDYLRRNTPLEVATWVLTDDGTTAIAGANFDFEPKNFDALSKRFTVEDYTNR
ncbi:MAG: hypothetical protein QOE33_1029 [Acidobacteriota bacterium]|nr:hypothetical protein [Acidobacteriota bacterium]